MNNFAAIAKPLYQQTEKTAKFTWSDKARVAFQELQLRLMIGPTLAFSDYEQPFILDTDTSDVGIGDILSQRQTDDSECVIACGSRPLSHP